jgi:site-specific DNA-cytosine methylase
LMKIKDWLISEGRESEWSTWSSELMTQDATFQKFEWHVREPPIESKSLDDTTRVKKRFKGRLIQFRPSGVRVSKGIRHPALVAIGQVPVVGHWLKRPNWKTLAKLQSIPEDFVKNNKRLFGDSSESGNSGEPIKRLGNAVNVHLVYVIASVIRKELSAVEDN